MRLLEAFANLFLDTFGITPPTEQARRQAAWFILGLLVTALVALIVIGTVLYKVMNP